MPHCEGDLHALQLGIAEDPRTGQQQFERISRSEVLALYRRTHHLFKNTSTTVLAMFKRIHAPSTMLARNPFFAGSLSLDSGSSCSSPVLLISMSSFSSSNEGMTATGFVGYGLKWEVIGVDPEAQADGIADAKPRGRRV